MQKPCAQMDSSITTLCETFANSVESVNVYFLFQMLYE